MQMALANRVKLPLATRPTAPRLRGAGPCSRGALQVAAAAKKGELFMWQALREGLDEEMSSDPTVCIMGEDVGHYGGSYKVTLDLYKKYGDLRVLDTPICENGFMGVGVGAAMTGLRPVVEGMNMGFLLLAFNQISNNCGMLHYTSGGQYSTPLVIRGPGGVGRQLGAEHSQRLESYFQSIPGVQLVAVSTVRNSKALFKSAIRSNNPVIFFEHVLLYNLKGEVGGPDEYQCLEKAEMVRPGTDISIFTYSRMRYVVMQAVAELEKKGYNPEVIDLISLKPFDMEAISKSVKKTRKVLIVEECMKTGGIGASLSAVISESLFNELDHEVVRLSSQDVPTAYAYELEAATIVQSVQVVEAVERVCGKTRALALA
ncbi:thiamine diphosphate-binding protein [Haematococcus lacustris]